MVQSDLLEDRNKAIVLFRLRLNIIFNVFQFVFKLLVRTASAQVAPSNKMISRDRSHEDWDTNPVKQEA